MKPAIHATRGEGPLSPKVTNAAPRMNSGFNGTSSNNWTSYRTNLAEEVRIDDL